MNTSNTHAYPPPASAPTGHTVRRSSTDRYLLGVCGGVARALDVPPLAVRATLLLAGVFLTPYALLAYLVTAAIVPTDDGAALLGEGRRDKRELVIAAVLALIAAPGIIVEAASHSVVNSWIIGPAAVAAGIAAVVLALRHRETPPVATAAGGRATSSPKPGSRR